MTKHVLELEPIEFTGHSPYEASPEEVLQETYAQQLREELSDALLEPEFSAASVLPMFVAAIDTYTPQVVEACLKAESWRREVKRPMGHRLGELAAAGVIDAPRADAVEVSPSFVESIKDQLETRGYDFLPLQTYRDAWGETRCLDFVRTVRELMGDDMSNDDLPAAHKLIADAAMKPDFTLPLDHPEALRLITFLPHATRRLTRRLIVNNFVAASIEQQVDSSDEEVAELMKAVKRYLALDALEGEHWDQYVRWRGADQAFVESLAYLGAEKIDILAEIQRYKNTSAMSEVSDVVVATHDRLNDMLEYTEDGTDISVWQREDDGHCFSQFIISYDFIELLGGPRFHTLEHEYASPVKDGTKAVILEDDPQQLKRWQKLINDHGVQTVPDELCTDDPSVVLGHAGDLDVSLFVLDTQIGDDEWAGLTLARELFKAKLNTLSNAEDPQSLPRVKIVLWSSSLHHTKVAEQHFKELEKQLRHDPHVSISGSWGGSSGSHLVLSLETRLKTIRPYNFAPRPDD